MSELKGRNSTSSIEKIAITVAINTAADLMKTRSGKSDEHPELTERLAAMNLKLKDLLEEPETT